MNIPTPSYVAERFTQAIRGAVSFPKSSNSLVIQDDSARQFLRNGNRRALIEDWSKVVMSDNELYTGYPYAAINNRANSIVEMSENNLKTNAEPSIIKAAKDKQKVVEHPYLELIEDSLDFSDTDFWYDISTYLDLEGVYYILAVRNVDGDRVGNVQEFKLLNPYEVRRIRSKETGKVGGYIETREGMIREIPTQMIIDIRALNPFSRDKPYAMTDAAKDSQFTLKQAGDYTRHSLKNNMAAPGIISTDILLEPEMFTNFVSRVTNQEKGLPLFGNGAGAISWDSMQIDLDKTGLKDINEINRSALFAVSGVSKTMMAIEESGTTRETAKVQKDLFTELHIIPQMRRIINALNQDYKRYYQSDYQKNKYKIYIDNPLGSDRDAEIKDIKIRDESYKLYDTLVGAGYDRELASKYACGEITLEELGDPTNDPRPNPIVEAANLKMGEDPKNDNLESPKKLKTKDKKKNRLNEEVINYNPNHDKDGKFGSGDSSTVDYGNNTNVESDKYIQKLYSNELNSYSKEELSAIKSYTSKTGAFDLNPWIRQGQKHEMADGRLPTEEYAKVLVKRDKIISGLDSAMSKTKLKNDTVLYRSATSKFNQNDGTGLQKTIQKKLSVGKTFKDKSYQSTALSKDRPEQFLYWSQDSKKTFKETDQENYLLKITAPKGTNGLFPSKYSSFKNESEFILARNTKLKITKKTKTRNDQGEYFLIEAKVVK